MHVCCRTHALRELTAVLALPPSPTVSPFYEQSLLIADKALAFICFTSPSLHVAKYGDRQASVACLYMTCTRCIIIVFSNDLDSSDQSGKEKWDVMTLFAT